MAATALANPLRHPPLQLVAGWLPAGVISTDPLKDIVRRAVPGRWVEHPNYWAVACDYGTGKRVPFGRVDAPTAELADAVAASCAIPGFYRPGQDRRPPLRGRRRLLRLEPRPARGPRARSRDLPQPALLARDDPRSNNPLDWLTQLSRAANGRRLRTRRGRSAPYGTKVVLIQPTAADLNAMGRNLMSPDRRRRRDRNGDRAP